MSKKTAAYQIVYSEMKRRILTGDYGIGSLLPTENKSMQEFGVSRTTIRRAMEMLSHEGFVRSTAGKGTEVINFKTRQSLNAVSSLSETLRRKGKQVRSKSLYIDEAPADEGFAESLQLEPSAMVTRFQRIQLSDEVPVAYMKNYIPSELIPDAAQHMTADQSLYIFLETRYGILIDKACDRITARVATFTEAQILNIPVGEALIELSRICYMNGKPVCLDQVSIVGKYYEFEIVLSGRYLPNE